MVASSNTCHGFGGWSSSADLPRARQPDRRAAHADQTAEHARRHADPGVRAATADVEDGPVRGAVVPLVEATGADVTTPEYRAMPMGVSQTTATKYPDR